MGLTAERHVDFSLVERCPLLKSEQREQLREDIARKRAAASEAAAG